MKSNVGNLSSVAVLSTRVGSSPGIDFIRVAKQRAEKTIFNSLQGSRGSAGLRSDTDKAVADSRPAADGEAGAEWGRGHLAVCAIPFRPDPRRVGKWSGGASGKSHLPTHEGPGGS